MFSKSPKEAYRDPWPQPSEKVREMLSDDARQSRYFLLGVLFVASCLTALGIVGVSKCQDAPCKEKSFELKEGKYYDCGSAQLTIQEHGGVEWVVCKCPYSPTTTTSAVAEQKDKE
jgi:uncharacterized protein (DUF169 family)